MAAAAARRLRGHRGSPPHVIRNGPSSGTRNLGAQRPLHSNRDATANVTPSGRRSWSKPSAALLGKRVRDVKNETGGKNGCDKRSEQGQEGRERERLGRTGEARRQGLRARTRPAAWRARQAAALGRRQGTESRGRVRRPRRRRQGRGHQGDHRACQPARLSRRRAARADRTREVADVCSALHAAPACRGRNRDLRPQLV